VKVLIADDDPHVRSAVGLVLANEPGISIVTNTPTVDALAESVLSTGADVVILDWDMPGFRRTLEMRRLHADAPNCQVIALTAHPAERQAPFTPAAISLVCKYDAPERLLGVIRSLLDR